MPFVQNRTACFAFNTIYEYVMARLFLSFSLILILTTTCQAQFGARGQVLKGSTTKGAEINGWDMGIHYWLRLKNYRLEFFPELTLSSVSFEQVQQKRFGVSVPLSLYFLEFKGDCQCPTFSKQNDLLKKGLFLQIVPALYTNQVAVTSPDSKTSYEDFDMGLGFGLDVGVNNLLTVTPLLHYVVNIHSNNSGEADGWARDIRFGIRLGFRPDY